MTRDLVAKLHELRRHNAIELAEARATIRELEAQIAERDVRIAELERTLIACAALDPRYGEKA